MPKPASELKTFFNPKTHIGGVIIGGKEAMWPSVTQLEKEFKLIDYSLVPDERLEYKRILGTRVHMASLWIDQGSFDEEQAKEKFPEILPYLEGYRKFRTIEDFEPLYKENRYFSARWRFHGAPDESGIHIGKIGGTNVLVDYKTTWCSYPAHGNQLAGYSMLIEECLGIKIKRRYSLLLKPTGNYDLVEFKDPRDLLEFQACLVLHWARREKHKTMTEEQLIQLYTQN